MVQSITEGEAAKRKVPAAPGRFELCGRSVSFREISQPAFPVGEMGPVEYVTRFWDEA